MVVCVGVGGGCWGLVVVVVVMVGGAGWWWLVGGVLVWVVGDGCW